MGLDWWNLRTWGQLDAAVSARCYANELRSWGPEWRETYEDAKEEAEASVAGYSGPSRLG